jgi:transposase-like protein
MLEPLIQEIRRRERVIQVFTNKATAWRFVIALLAEKYEEWSTERRYWSMDEFCQ